MDDSSSSPSSRPRVEPNQPLDEQVYRTGYFNHISRHRDHLRHVAPLRPIPYWKP